MLKRKKIPYGIPNFESIRTQNYLYVDKTRFIEILENEDTKCHFLIRPRKFGKSLFVSMLEHYYDVRFKSKFQELFGDLYIGQNPTEKANEYFVLNFDFSGLDTSDIESFNESFTATVKNSIITFLTVHSEIFKEISTFKNELKTITSARACLEFTFNIIHSFGKKAFILVDEYDHFVNDILAKGTTFSKNQNQDNIWSNRVIISFYETLKAGTKSVVDRIFLTGITPISFDNLTSGFNIMTNLSLETRYNEILGFTKEEIEWVIEQINLDKSFISVDLEYMYGGYLFDNRGNDKIYNTSMILFYFKGLATTGKSFKYLIDDYEKIDYSKIKNLLKKEYNKQIIRELAENKSISSNVINLFSLEFILEEKNFLSILFYLGLVTIDNSNPNNSALKVPNYAIKTMYWEFVNRMLFEGYKGFSS